MFDYKLSCGHATTGGYFGGMNTTGKAKATVSVCSNGSGKSWVVIDLGGGNVFKAKDWTYEDDSERTALSLLAVMAKAGIVEVVADSEALRVYGDILNGVVGGVLEV